MQEGRIKECRDPEARSRFAASAAGAKERVAWLERKPLGPPRAAREDAPRRAP